MSSRRGSAPLRRTLIGLLVLLGVGLSVTGCGSDSGESAMGSAGSATPDPETEAPGPEEEIDAILARADEAIDKGRFTMPPGKSALELILRAEDIDPEHEGPGKLRERAVKEILRASSALADAGDEVGAAALMRDIRWFDPDHVLAAESGKDDDFSEAKVAAPSRVVAGASKKLRKPDLARLERLVSNVELAVLDRRLVAPPGDNALKYLLDLRALDPKNRYVKKLEARVAKLMREAAKDAATDREELVAGADTLEASEDAVDATGEDGEAVSDASSAPETSAKAKKWIDMGREHLAAARYDAARKAFQKALDLDESSHAALAGLSDVAFQTGDMTRAVLFGKRAVKLAPKVARYHVSLGNAYFDLVRYKDAVRHWNLALKIRPGDASIKKKLALAREKLK